MPQLTASQSQVEDNKFAATIEDIAAALINVDSNLATLRSRLESFCLNRGINYILTNDKRVKDLSISDLIKLANLLVRANTK